MILLDILNCINLLRLVVFVLFIILPLIIIPPVSVTSLEGKQSTKYDTNIVKQSSHQPHDGGPASNYLFVGSSDEKSNIDTNKQEHRFNGDKVKLNKKNVKRAYDTYEKINKGENKQQSATLRVLGTVLNYYFKRLELRSPHLTNMNYQVHVNHLNDLKHVSQLSGLMPYKEEGQLLSRQASIRSVPETRDNFATTYVSARPGNDSDKIVLESPVGQIDNDQRVITSLNLQKQIEDTDLNELRVYIYTSESVIESTVPKSKQSIVELPIDMKDKQVAVSVHGFRNRAHESIQQNIKNALLNYYDYVILLDWSTYAQTLNYVKAAARVLNIGQILGSYLVNLVELKKLHLNNLHLFGYSLGAHIVSFASKYIQRHSGRPVAKITAFDPALYMFITRGLDRTDAKVVLVIHTNAGQLGQSEQLGHFDYYPNGGLNQPGCEKLSASTWKTLLRFYSASTWYKMLFKPVKRLTCAHARAIVLYTYMIANSTSSEQCEFVGYPCETYKEYLNGKCYKCVMVNDETQECLQMSHEHDAPTLGDNGIELPKLYFIAGSPKENLCLANYRIRVLFGECISELAEYGKTTFTIHLSFGSSQNEELSVGIDLTARYDDDSASKLFVLPAGPVKITCAKIMKNDEAKKVALIEIIYLSHREKKVRDKYSSILSRDRKSAIAYDVYAEITSTLQER